MSPTSINIPLGAFDCADLRIAALRRGWTLLLVFLLRSIFLLIFILLLLLTVVALLILFFCEVLQFFLNDRRLLFLLAVHLRAINCIFILYGLLLFLLPPLLHLLLKALDAPLQVLVLVKILRS